MPTSKHMSSFCVPVTAPLTSLNAYHCDPTRTGLVAPLDGQVVKGAAPVAESGVNPQNGSATLNSWVGASQTTPR